MVFYCFCRLLAVRLFCYIRQVLRRSERLSSKNALSQRGTGAKTEKALIVEQSSGQTLSIKKLDGTIH